MSSEDQSGLEDFCLRCLIMLCRGGEVAWSTWWIIGYLVEPVASPPEVFLIGISILQDMLEIRLEVKAGDQDSSSSNS